VVANVVVVVDVAAEAAVVVMLAFSVKYAGSGDIVPLVVGTISISSFNLMLVWLLMHLIMLLQHMVMLLPLVILHLLMVIPMASLLLLMCG
jgi:hypothetical protein